MHFIMEHEQMSYPEALKYLAKKYGIEIKERELSSEEKIAQSERESLFIVNNFARDYFQNILKNHVDGRSIGMAYFRSRGFRDDICDLAAMPARPSRAGAPHPRSLRSRTSRSRAIIGSSPLRASMRRTACRTVV